MNIPSQHEGGNLVLQPPGEQEIVWKTSGFTANEWIAFSTTVPHEMLPMTSGTKRVAQLNIYTVDDVDTSPQ